MKTDYIQSNTFEEKVSTHAMARSEFNERILECIDRGFDQFGFKIKHFIYWQYCQMTKASNFSIINSYSEFSVILGAIFGKGAEVIEAAIAKEIMKEFNIKHSKSKPLALIVEEARRTILVEEAV